MAGTVFQIKQLDKFAKDKPSMLFYRLLFLILTNSEDANEIKFWAMKINLSLLDYMSQESPSERWHAEMLRWWVMLIMVFPL